MQAVHTISELRAKVKTWRSQGLTIGFVPTMGNLHEGHMTLVRQAQQNADRVIVSIFVNPMQFDRADDLAAYPRTLDADCRALAEIQTDLVFAPNAEEMYPGGTKQQTFVEVPGLSEMLEGACRPGHFRGVATVVTKLFNMVQPDIACFGQKDFQQLAVIRQMTRDLALPIEIIGVPTVRAQDGLALSSRNGYLSPSERQQAPKLAQVMHQLQDALAAGNRDIESLVAQASDELNQGGFRTDAIDIVDADRLTPVDADSQQAVILMAAFLGKARLIDNCVVQLTESKDV